MWSIYWIVLYGKSLDTPNLDCLRSWRMALNFSFALQRHPHADDLRRVWANLELNITNSQHFPTSSKMDGFLHVFTIRICCSLDYFGRLWKSLPSQDSNLVEPKARKNAGYKQQAQLRHHQESSGQIQSPTILTILWWCLQLLRQAEVRTKPASQDGFVFLDNDLRRLTEL